MHCHFFGLEEVKRTDMLPGSALGMSHWLLQSWRWCISLPTSLHAPSPPSPWQPFSASMSFCFVFKILHISDTMQHLPFSGLFHLAECLWGPSMLLQMTEVISFSEGWIIIHCTYMPYLLYPFTHWWTFRLFLRFDCCE